jgi:hypothetical protein
MIINWKFTSTARCKQCSLSLRFECRVGVITNIASVAQSPLPDVVACFPISLSRIIYISYIFLLTFEIGCIFH